MSDRCFHVCFRTNTSLNSERDGWRATYFFPKGGTYKGCWQMNKRHFYGVQVTPKGLIYDGQWQNDKRHGYGTLRRKSSQGDHTYERIYIGEWRNDMKCGEGKQYYPDGVYYGWWRSHRRHGLGLMLYNDERVYLGEWQADVPHGLGVFIYANGNRYEGCFARGLKNGEGTFYHMHTGQIQKGMWENDVCKTSLIQDDFRNQVDKPTEFPIQKSQLLDGDHFVRKIFCKYMKNENKPSRSFQEFVILSMVKRKRFYAKLEPSAILHTNLNLDVEFPCACKRNEKLVLLREQ